MIKMRHVIYRRVIRNGENTDLEYFKSVIRDEAESVLIKHAHVNSLEPFINTELLRKHHYTDSDVVYGDPTKDGLVLVMRGELYSDIAYQSTYTSMLKYTAPGQVTGLEDEFLMELGAFNQVFKKDSYAKAAIEKIFNTEVRVVYTVHPGKYENGNYVLNNRGTIIVHRDGSIVIGGKLGQYTERGTQWAYIRGPERVKEKKEKRHATNRPGQEDRVS